MNKPINSTINNLSAQTTFKELSDEMSKYDIVSFDLFDTLIERCFHRPIDLFYFIEHAYQAPGFARHRMKADKTARKTRQKKFNDNEVTIDEIYQHVSKDFNYLYDIELETEIKSLTPKFIGIKLLKNATDLDKKIIITTDTYFTRSFIVNLLVENGIKGYHDLFVSSELRKSKISGNLYDHIKANLNLSDKKILHIGDNFNADINMANKKNIDSLFIHHDFKYIEDQNYKRLQRKTKNKVFWRSSLADLLPKFSIFQRVAEIAYRSCPNASFWQYAGIFFAGPMVLAYLRWIKKCIEQSQAEHVIFVSRDGYILRNIFEKYFKTVPSTYHYLNRSVVKQLKASEELKSQYVAYLKHLGIFGQKIVVVDSQTTDFSVQGMCANLGIKTIGCYWNVNRQNNEHQYSAFLDLNREIRLHKRFVRSDILEFFMSAPYLSVEKIEFKDSQPRTILSQSANPAEYTRIECASEFDKGVDAFVASYFDKVSRLTLDWSASDILNWLDLLLCEPTETERRHFEKIEHQSDLNDEIYRKTFRRFMRQSIWRKFTGR